MSFYCEYFRVVFFSKRFVLSFWIRKWVNTLHDTTGIQSVCDKIWEAGIHHCYQFVKDYHEAQNLSQETFLSAYRHIDTYQGDNYKPWIARIATNKAKDYLNSAYSRRVMLASSEEDSVETLASVKQIDSSQQPDEMYISKEGSGTIEQMIRSLKEPYREVCILKFIEEKDTQEIADLLGRPKRR